MPTTASSLPRWRWLRFRLQSLFAIGAAVAMGMFTSELSSGDEPADESYSIQFLGEDGKPIPNARFFLYDQTGGMFRSALYRDHPMNRDAKINLDGLPMEFMLGVTSDAHYYSAFWDGDGGKLTLQAPDQPKHGIHLKRGENVIRVETSGTVSITFAQVDKQIRNPLVVPYYRKAPMGEYNLAGGIGIFVGEEQPFEIEGLSPGTYRFELKKDYTSSEIYWSISGVAVDKGQTTKLKGLAAIFARPLNGREAAFFSLADKGREAEISLAVLLEMCATDNKMVRIRAMDIVEQRGAEAKAANPVLRKVLSHKDIEVRVSAAVALWALKPERDAFMVLVDAATEDHPQVRDLAKRVIASSPMTSIPLLEEIAAQGTPHARAQASIVLDRLEAEETAVPALIQALGHPIASVREIAARMLGKLGRKARAAVEALIKALSDASDLVRLSAANALGEIGPDAKAAIPILRKGPATDDDALQSAMSAALRKIEMPARGD